MKRKILLFTIYLLFTSTCCIEAAMPTTNDYLNYAKAVADGEMNYKSLESSVYKTTWNYKLAFLNNAYLNLYEATQVDSYYDYVETIADNFLDEQGLIMTYTSESFDLRNICGGKFLYDIYYHNRGGSRYLNSMILLRKQLHKQPRTEERAFWFSQAHTNQLWLDGLYMAMPFYCLYAAILDEPQIFNDVAIQFTIAERRTLDKATGLNYQAWDEMKTCAWANKATGTTTAFFGQSIGFYMMALVDMLDYFPVNHSYRGEIIKTLNRVASALTKYQDKSGMWYQVVNMPKDKANFLESSSTAMYAYAFAKGVNNGYLPKKYRKFAEKAFSGLVNNCIDYDENAQTAIVTRGTSDADLDAGDGTVDFYLNLPLKNREPNATVAFIMAAVELAKY